MSEGESLMPMRVFFWALEHWRKVHHYRRTFSVRPDGIQPVQKSKENAWIGPSTSRKNDIYPELNSDSQIERDERLSGLVSVSSDEISSQFFASCPLPSARHINVEISGSRHFSKSFQRNQFSIMTAEEQHGLTLRIRLIRSFEHRNIRFLVLRNIDPSGQLTGKELKELIRKRSLTEEKDFLDLFRSPF